MFENVQKKLMNFYILADLGKMSRRIPKNFSHVMQLQNERVQKLAKKAYEIPFYRERFDRAGVKPEEIRTDSFIAELVSRSHRALNEKAQE